MLATLEKGIAVSGVGRSRLIQGFAAIWLVILWFTASTGSWLLVLLICLTSIASVALANKLQGQSFRQTFDPRLASWAFLADPVLVGGIAAFLATKGETELTSWSLLGMLAAGILAMVAIRKFDFPRYKRYGALGSFNSWGKKWHDFYSVPLVAGALVGILVPVLVKGPYYGWYWVGVACLSIWVAAAIKDLVKEPNPCNQHPNVVVTH